MKHLLAEMIQARATITDLEDEIIENQLELWAFLAKGHAMESDTEFIISGELCEGHLNPLGVHYYTYENKGCLACGKIRRVHIHQPYDPD